MKINLKRLISITLKILIFIIAIFLINEGLTRLVELTNVVCKNEKFSTAELAIAGMEKYKRENYSSSLDYCPPYELVYSFDFDGNTIVFFSYCRPYDGTKEQSYAVRILKHNDDGTYSFTGAFVDFELKEPSSEKMSYHYFTNLKTSKGEKSISILYLEKDNKKDIYVDGIKCKKTLVNIDGKEFYVCYGISKRDTFLSNLFTRSESRHKIEII